MQVLFDIPNFSCIMQLRAENQNLVSALSNYQQILYQFFDFTQNLKQSPIYFFKTELKLYFFPIAALILLTPAEDDCSFKILNETSSPVL